MSWNIKVIGERANVKAAVLAETQIPPALKEAIVMVIEAGTGDATQQQDFNGVRVETVGHYEGASAYSSISKCEVEPLRLAKPAAK